MEYELTDMEKAALNWPARAAEIEIKDQVTYDRAAATLLEIKKVEKNIKLHHAPLKTTAHAAHQAAIAAEKKYLGPLTEAKGVIAKTIATWEDEQARLKRIADDVARLEAIRIEEEKKIEEAEEAENEGADYDKTSEILDKPVAATYTPPADTYQRKVGLGLRLTWHAEVTDIKALCRAVVDGTMPAGAVQANMVYLNAAARTDKGKMNIPGVKAVSERK